MGRANQGVSVHPGTEWPQTSQGAPADLPWHFLRVDQTGDQKHCWYVQDKGPLKD